MTPADRRAQCGRQEVWECQIQSGVCRALSPWQGLPEPASEGTASASPALQQVSTCHVPSSRDAIDPDNTLYSVIVLIQVLPVYDKQHSFRGIHICMALMQGWAHGNRD